MATNLPQRGSHINGVSIKELKALSDDRGFLMEMLRADEPIYERFGQVYITGCKRGVVKGWHYHKEQTDHFICVAGRALVVLYDPREGSSSKGWVEEHYLESPPGSDRPPILLKIPPYVYHGFTAVECDEARLINVPTLPYRHDRPDEFRHPWNSTDIPYQWPADVTRGG
ncbi:MAG TPA: dTDP-4-dehydrorhamnose 3,5-epimerase family protein [Nitrospiria bacterium]|nr:dTDP-4-dehydrorhamnose 3,5-epimerase family protein [Nitrospiria bacterium]